MADVESKSIPHELPSSHWLKATGQCVLERYLSATMGKKQKRNPFISWLLPGTCHPFRNILSSGFIRADGVEISDLYHLNNTYYSTSYLYRTRYNENDAFEHSD